MISEEQKQKQREERMKFLALLNKKQIFSRVSEQPVVFVDDIDDETLPQDKAYSDGILMLDYVANVEDDIQQMYSILKDGSYCNMEDFYTKHHAFDDGETFNEEIERLMADIPSQNKNVTEKST